ncbi:hypothetical protein KKC32_04280 [Patescibacteria group bacterium]|nr:hypothetical protein [Patescibacteria group bacterium]
MKFNKSTIFRPLIFLALILANFLIFHNSIAGLCIGMIFLLIYGRILGKIFFPEMNAFFSTGYGSFSFAGLFSLGLWINFYLYKIDQTVFILNLLAVTILAEIIIAKFRKNSTEQTFSQMINGLKNFFHSFNCKLLSLIFLGSSAFNFYLLAKNSSDATIASPWHLLPNQFFIVFGLASVALIAIIYRNRQYLNVSLAFAAIHLFQMSSIALFIYKIGYGYDPFLHLATIKAIIANGTIAPKPLYYIGEYSLIIFLQGILQVPLELINRALLPAMFSIFAPLTVFYSLFAGLKLKARPALIASLCLAFLPLTYFINTTPQGITNLLCLEIIFLGFLARKKLISGYFLFCIGLFTIMIHPLYGVPIMLYVLFLSADFIFKKRYLQIIGKMIMAAMASIVFPALFFLNSIINSYNISFDFHPRSILTGLLSAFEKQRNLIFDFIYIYGFNNKLIYFSLVLLGIVLVIYRKKVLRFYETWIFGIILMFNYFFMKIFISLDFVSANDTDLFSQRILELALYFFLPTVLYCIYVFIKKNFEAEKNFTGKIFAIFCLAAILGQSLYFSYPIFDDYKNSKEYNISISDIRAVHFIEENAVSEYIVLANQMLAAAAIREYGFKKYYNGDFYYSIPTGNDNGIYTSFKKMVFEKPLREYADAAMNAAGVGNAYLIVNDYWTASKLIVSRAKETADDWNEIDNGKIHIFHYQKQTEN